MNSHRMGLRSAFAVLLVMLAGPSISAQLLKDINTVPVPVSSNPRYLGAVGSNALFVAGKGTASSELGLWSTDGTVAGTRLIFANDASPAFFGSQSLLTLGSRVLWSGPGAPDVQDLWASDGATAGTVKIAELNATPLGVLGVLPNGVAMFAAATLSNTGELWRTDGTAAGTFRVAEFDALDTNMQSAVVGNQLYFAATTSATGTELWVSDGSNVPSHTHLEADLEAGPDSSGPFQLTAIGNTLYFDAVLNNSGVSQLFSRNAAGTITQLTNDQFGASILCAAGNLVIYHSLGQPGRSDGTIGGTFRLLAPSHTPFDGIGPCVTAGNRVFFSASTTGTGTLDLWQSDGTVNGTAQVPVGATVLGPTPLFWSGTHLFFYATEAATGTELWVTDGTGPGTHIVMDSFPGPSPESGAVSVIGASGSQVFILNVHVSSNFPNDLISQVWRADPDGTHAARLTDNVSIDPYGSSFPYSLLANGHLFFTSRSPTIGIEPSASDGTLAGTVLLKDIAPQTQNLPSQPLDFTSFSAETTIFSADDGVNGRELWRTDGTANGTTLLKDILPGSASSTPAPLGFIDGTLYFAADDGVHGRELWLTDGTSAGTHFVADLEPGAGGAQFQCVKLVKLGAFKYFSVRTTASGTELWRTDGTSAGTQLVSDVVPGAAGSNACPLAALGSSLYFAAEDAAAGRELWVTDGTAAGTHLAADIVPGGFGSNPTMAIEFQNELVFAAASVPTGLALPRQVWRTNTGTPSLLLNVSPGGIGWIQPLGSALYFAVIGGNAGLYRWTGGTAAPERLVLDAAPFTTTQPVVFGGRLAFVGSSVTEGIEVFATDGTAAGTSAMTNLSNAGENNVGGPLTVLGQKLYFGVHSPDLAEQLGRTDGTPQGTQVLTQFVGQFRGVIAPPALAGGQIILSADDGVSDIGTELFVQPNQLPNAANDTASVTAGQSVSINVTANDTDADGTVLASTVRVFLLPAHGSVLISSTGMVTYNPNAGFSGTDTFTYIVSDDTGAQSAPGTVTVTVNAPAPPPPPPPSNGGSSGGGGGGGAFDLLTILSLSSLVVLRLRRSRKSAVVCADAG